MYYHRVGQEQDSDVPVFALPSDPECRFLPQVSDDGKYLMLEPTPNSLNCGLFIADLEANGDIKGWISFKTNLPTAYYKVSEFLYKI